MKEKLNRRNFLKQASLATVVGGASLITGCSTSDSGMEAPNINLNETTRWRIVTTWPSDLPILMDGVRKLADDVKVMSGGRLEIEVFGAGELLPALETFNAVNAGTAQLGHGAAYYWADRIPAAQFFTAVPFGMNAQQMYAWLFGGGGMALWEEAYADFDLVPIPAGNTGIQMGGWFNKEINTLADYQGLKMRMPGLGGRVISAVGGSAELIAAGDIYTSLERGVIDATEWVGPYHDEALGFHQVTDYYYYPGWHEPGSTSELLINRQAWEALSPDLQMILRTAALSQNNWQLAQFDAKNGSALRRLVQDEGVELRAFPSDVMEGLRRAAQDVLLDVADSDAMAGKVYDSFRNFQQEVGAWGDVSEAAYYNLIQASS